MKADAWEAGHRMPFIVRWPGTVRAGSVCDQTMSFTDVLATMADVVGKGLPAGAGPDSFSLLPALKGGTFQRAPIVMQSGSGFMTIRSGRWKLIEGLGSGGFSKPAKITAGRETRRANSTTLPPTRPRRRTASSGSPALSSACAPKCAGSSRREAAAE